MVLTIQPSELVINQRGGVYHLDLTPKEVAQNIITVGDPDRVQAISSHFDRIEHKSQHREFVTHTGYYKGKHLSVISTGIGPDNIDIVLNELDALHNIDFETRQPKSQLTRLTIIRVGTCGGIQADVPLESWIASKYCFGLDNLIHFYAHPENTAEEIELLSLIRQQVILPEGTPGYLYSCSNRLEKIFSPENGYIHGLTITCPGFYGPQGRVLRGQLSRPLLNDQLTDFKSPGGVRSTNFEMETSAIYSLSRLLGHDCISLSVVLANRDQGTFSADPSNAVKGLINAVLHAISLSDL
jgi:uridine phosphorylase